MFDMTSLLLFFLKIITLISAVVNTAFTALLYIAGGLFVLAINIANVPASFIMIFKYAFIPQALVGGGVDAAIAAAISKSAKRDLFSNEADMGSTPNAHALANVKEPHTQGTPAMIGVFIDTFVVLTATALVVLSTLYENGAALITPDLYKEGAYVGLASNAATAQKAFGYTFAKLFGAEIQRFCKFLFAKPLL